MFGDGFFPCFPRLFVFLQGGEAVVPLSGAVAMRQPRCRYGRAAAILNASGRRRGGGQSGSSLARHAAAANGAGPGAGRGSGGNGGNAALGSAGSQRVTAGDAG